MSTRRSKKSETLEVRLEHEVKTALMRKAQQQGRSTSDVVREFIDEYLADKPKEAHSMIVSFWKPVTAMGAASVAALVAIVAPTAVHAKPDLRAIFQSLDRDANGAVTLEEFQQHIASPEIRNAHEAHKAAGHKGMGDAHGMGAHADHARLSPEALRAHFAKLDSNSDGAVKFDEVEAHHKAMERSHKAR